MKNFHGEPGLKFSPRSHSNDYVSVQSFEEMIGCIAEIVREKIIDKFFKAEMLSILIDESEDKAGHFDL